MSVWFNGDADIDLVQSVINPYTGLVSVMTVSNEIGRVVLFHADVAQALGEIPGDVQKTRLKQV
ncbi:hypothetical protein AAG906_038107 [Vitis piasezkii]